MEKEIVEAKGYTYVGMAYKEFSGIDMDASSEVDGILVWKDGFYGILDNETGEELTPCVHLNGQDAINDVYIINARTRDKGKRKKVGIQKILKDNLGDKLYDPYAGTIVRLMFDILALPNSVCYNDTYYEKALDEEQCIKVALKFYESITSLLNKGGKRFLIYDYGINPDFLQYCRELEKAVNGDILYRICREYDSLNPEEIAKIDAERETIGPLYKKYIRFLPALHQLVKIRKFNSIPGIVRRTEVLMMKKPLIDIGPSETVYYEDLHEPNNEVKISKEAFKKGVSIDSTNTNKY